MSGAQTMLQEMQQKRHALSKEFGQAKRSQPAAGAAAGAGEAVVGALVALRFIDHSVSPNSI